MTYPTIETLFTPEATTAEFVTYTVKDGTVKHGQVIAVTDGTVKDKPVRWVTIGTLSDDGFITNVWTKRGALA